MQPLPTGPTGPGAIAGRPGAGWVNPRGPSSRSQLEIDWIHPVYTQETSAREGRTFAVQERRALPTAEALAYVAADDPRPLLVVRECMACKGTDGAILERQTDNERTFLLSRWFRCIKLPPDVLEEDHPFRNLFPGSDPGHLFVSNRDGSSRHDLPGGQSRTKLWAAMDALLKENYATSADLPLKKLNGILDELDRIDQEILDLATRLELALAGSGSSGKIAKLKRKVTDKRARRSELLAEAARVSKLDLRGGRSETAAGARPPEKRAG